MKLEKSDIKILSEEGIRSSYTEWNGTRNCPGLETCQGLKYPKSLITAALKDFNEECGDRHINASMYRYVRVNEYNSTYQVDFHCDEDPTGNRFTLCNIYFDTSTRQIVQRCFEL